MGRQVDFDPVAAGVGVVGAGLDIWARDQQQTLAIRQAKETRKVRLQGAWDDWTSMRDMTWQKNNFAVEERMMQRKIANERLIPQISKSVNLAWDSVAAQDFEQDQADSYLRTQIQRRMLEVAGSGGSEAGSRSGNYKRARQLEVAKGGQQLQQLEQKGRYRDAAKDLRIRKLGQEADMAREKILAPLDMPIYMQKVPAFSAIQGPQPKFTGQAIQGIGDILQGAAAGFG